MDTALVLKALGLLLVALAGRGAKGLATRWLELRYRERKELREHDSQHELTADQHEKIAFANSIARLEADIARIREDRDDERRRALDLEVPLADLRRDLDAANRNHGAALTAKAKAEAALHEALTDAATVRNIADEKVEKAAKRLAEANLRAERAEHQAAELTQALEDLQASFQRSLAECERERALAGDDLAEARAIAARLRQEIRQLGGRSTGPLPLPPADPSP